MKKSLKDLADKTLKYLCVGSYIEGINFYGLKILFAENEVNKARIDGQIYLNIEGKFAVLPSLPEFFPTADTLPELDWIESSKIICELRMKKVVDLWLSIDVPNLIIIFESGEVLYINGHNDKYESWQLGVWGNTNKDEIWEIVCCPGDDIAVWAPDDFVG